MTRTYSLLIEGDESGYSAHVPELPSIVVTGKSIDDLRRRAAEAIQLWWEENRIASSSDVMCQEVEVELPG